MFRSVIWRPSTTIILIIGVILILISLVVSYMLTTFRPTTQVSIGSGVYSLWVADTDIERTQGLSGTEKLGPNGGLLMKFDTAHTHGIWMKDMNFPLDLVWLDNAKKVVYIVKNAPPENPVGTIYAPEDAALYVIELPAGSVQKSGIKTGDTANFNIDV